jgi:hypothetical protein
MDDLDEFLGRFGARILGWRVWIHDVLTDMTFDNLGDEPIERTAAGGRLL